MSFELHPIILIIILIISALYLIYILAFTFGLYNLKEKLQIELVVAHINHMIREEADEEEQFVKEFCQKINVEFYSKRIEVEKYANNNKIGLEEAGSIAVS